MTDPSRLYYDPDDMDARPTFSPKGIGRSDMAKRADAIIAEGRMRFSMPFGPRSHSQVRGYIAGLDLSPPRLMRLVMDLGTRAASAGHAAVDGSGRMQDRDIAFYCYRAALSLLVEVTPRTRGDMGELLDVLLIWPGALPPSMQSKVAAVVGAYVADTITGRPFKRRSLIPRGGR